jgi:L-ribulokinase
MGRIEHGVYTPDAKRAGAYDELYAEYRTLHDYFSGAGAGANDVLHRLRQRRNAAQERGAGTAREQRGNSAGTAREQRGNSAGTE